MIYSLYALHAGHDGLAYLCADLFHGEPKGDRHDARRDVRRDGRVHHDHHVHKAF